MKRMHDTTKTLFAFLLGLMLLSGGYGTALAQDAGAEEGKNGGMMAMMEDCPMMKDSEKRAEMMENCPMMKDGAEMDHAAMMEMMKTCPMMQEMMKDCPMMQGHVQHEGHGTTGHSAAATADAADGVQVVEVTVGAMGYAPKQIELKAGVPARLTFTRTAEGGCMHQVQSPELGIEKTDLPLNEPVTFTFTPEVAGPYTFACGMGMMKGTVVVTS